jgi:hypothetical protein
MKRPKSTAVLRTQSPIIERGIVSLAGGNATFAPGGRTIKGDITLLAATTPYLIKGDIMH